MAVVRSDKGLGTANLEPIFVVLGLVGLAWLARLVKPSFRCDKCGQRKPRREYSGRGGWADWCRECADGS